jgi:hypothetical protein
MRTFTAIVCICSAAILGVLSGWFSRPLVDPRPTTEESPVAITYTGETVSRPGDRLADTPPGAKRSRAESLALLEEANRRNDTVLRDAILSEWARHETAEGVRSIFKLGNRLEGWQLLHAWASHEPAEAVEIATIELDGIADANWYDGVVTKSLFVLLLTDPQNAVALERGFFRRGSGDLEYLFEMTDLPANTAGDLLESLSEFRDVALRDRFIIKFVFADRLDPAKALDWAAARRDMKRPDSFSNLILSDWLSRNPDSAGAYVSDQFNGSEASIRLVRQFLDLTATRFPETLLSWMRQQDRELLANAAPLRLGGLKPEEEASLAALLAALLANEFPEFIPVPAASPPATIADLPKTWPPKSKTEAQAWFNTFQRLSNADDHLGPDSWTRESVNEVLDLLSDLPTSRESAMTSIATAWARVDPKEAITWAAGLPDQESIKIASFALASWMRESPGDARAYVAAIPESEFRVYAVEQSVRQFPEEKRDEAEQWLLGLAPDLARDAGLRELANDFLVYRGTPQIDGVRYERAVRLFQQVANPVVRGDGLESSLRKLSTHEPARALELIAESGLPDEIAARLETFARNALENRRKYEQNRKAKQAQ